ncbi:MAG: S26 family signal peptidase [Thermoplasmata archaeon]|nr:S26 family signal peptidase [Thermoplasmata archaeon]
MSRRDSDEEDAEEEEPDDEPPARRGRSRRHAAAGSDPVRPWSPEGGETEEGKGGWFHRGPKRPVYWRARDSLWFEPVVALAILVLLIVSLYAYTQNWPPVYVIESSSMQHGTNDVLGDINTGDLVLAQKIDPNKVVPYEVGLQTGYTTYGEYGDVLLYYPNGDTSVTPIIHRALLFLEWNPLNHSYNATELAPLPCSLSSHPYYRTANTPTSCETTGVTGTLELYGVGWQGVTVSVQLADLGDHSGFLTMGDNNLNPATPGSPPTGNPDEPELTSLVEPGWVLGVARGMIPWFGSLKLLLQGDASMVPSQSWQWLGLTLAGIVLAGLGVHLAVARIERRREAERTGAAPTEEDAQLGLLTRLLERLRRPGGEDDSEEEDAPLERRKHKTVHVDPRRLSHRGGRPAPKVRRSSANSAEGKHRAHPRDRDDSKRL